MNYPCPACGASADHCASLPNPFHCCAPCSGNHDNDTYDRYYPNTEREIA